MKLLEKVKAGAEQAAARARDEVQELQLKRDLAQAITELGETAFELVDGNELAHPRLEPIVERVRKAKAELAGAGTEPVRPAATPAD